MQINFARHTKENMLTKKILCFSCLILFSGFIFAKDEGDRARLQERLEKAGNILNEITSAPDKGIPQDILAHSECVGVIPTMMKAGFGFGGSQMRVTGCSSMSFGAAPVTPCSSSKKPRPRMLIVRLM